MWHAVWQFSQPLAQWKNVKTMFSFCHKPAFHVQYSANMNCLYDQLWVIIAGSVLYRWICTEMCMKIRYVWSWHMVEAQSSPLSWSRDVITGAGEGELCLQSFCLDDMPSYALSGTAGKGISSVTDCNYLYSVNQKNPPCVFQTFFPKRLGSFNNFLHTYLCIPNHARLQIFIHLSPTLTKLCHTRYEHFMIWYGRRV